MTWSGDLELPHEGINDQHKALVAAVNAFADAARVDDDSDPTEMLIFLTRYAEEHFRDEEQLMIDTAYPEYANHRALHQAQFRDVEGHVQAFLVDGESAELLDFLRDWLRFHIGGPDRAFSSYLAARP